VSPDQSVRVEERCDVRVRVVGVRVDAAEMFCIASIKESYLGVIT
jgi:DNA-directed RNA polymerase II subunit RPB7